MSKQGQFNFADYPMSVSETRGDKQGDPNAWTCRDILIRALRDLDAGRINPDTMLITYVKYDGGDSTVGYYNKSPNTHASVGLLAEVQHLILEG